VGVIQDVENNEAKREELKKLIDDERLNFGWEFVSRSHGQVGGKSS
jgi:hypothetical protein